MLLLFVLLLFRCLTAAPVGESEAREGLVFPTRPPTTPPTTTADWKETVKVDETDGKSEQSTGFWSAFLDFLSRNHEEDDLIWAEYNNSDFEELKGRYLSSSQYRKIGKPDGLTEDLLTTVVNEKYLHKKLLESIDRMEDLVDKGSELNAEIGHNSAHRYAVAAHYFCPFVHTAYSLNYVLTLQEHQHVLPGYTYQDKDQCRYGIYLEHLELIKDEKGKLPRKIHLDPQYLDEENNWIMEAHIIRPDFAGGKKWPQEDVQSEYDWENYVLGRDEALPVQVRTLKESIRALTTLRGARHLNISCEDIDRDDALENFLCNKGDYRNFVERDLNLTELNKIDWGFRINLYKIISDLLPLSEKTNNGRICGHYHLWPKVVESRTQLGMSELLDSVYSVDRSWTRTYDRALEFTTEQPPFYPFRVGRSDVFMKRIRKAELDDGTVAKRRKLDCELGKIREGKRNFVVRVWNWIWSWFVSEPEC